MARNFTSPELAKLRRKQGGTWHIFFVAEGFDEVFDMYVGRKHPKEVAIALVKFEASKQLKCKFEHIIIQRVEDQS